MNCHKAYSKLLVLSREELYLPSNIELVQHLHNCPFCDSFREMWLKVDQDIEMGLKFSPPKNFWTEFTPPIDTKVNVKSRSIFRALLWKMDWLFYPEKSLKWAGAFSLIVVMSLGGIKLQQLQLGTSPGLPNHLEISRFLGNNTIQESLETGISFNNQSTSNTEAPDKIVQTL